VEIITGAGAVDMAGVHALPQISDNRVMWAQHKFIGTPLKQALGGRPPRYVPAPLLPHRTAEPTAAPADGNVAVGSHGEYFPTLTAAAA